MPFNRDLIESGCVLKTFDGDLSVLEQAIDFTLKKSSIPHQKSEAVVVAPVSKQISTVAACAPRERRHIKEVVYGDRLDELPSTSLQEAQAVSAPVSKQVLASPAVSTGFCFRHLVEDAQHAIDFTETDSAISAQKREATVSKHMSTAAACLPRGKRHVKDVVYGLNLDELPSTPMQETQSVGHPVSKQVVEIPAATSGFSFKHPHVLSHWHTHELQ